MPQFAIIVGKKNSKCQIFKVIQMFVGLDCELVMTIFDSEQKSKKGPFSVSAITITLIIMITFKPQQVIRTDRE